MNSRNDRLIANGDFAIPDGLPCYSPLKTDVCELSLKVLKQKNCGEHIPGQGNDEDHILFPANVATT
jgi:hypothetical protein